MQRRVRTQSRTPTTSGGGYAILGGWLGRLARLDFDVFDDVRGERTATASAIMIVLAASVLAGLGSWAWALQHSEFEGLDTMPVFVKTVLAGSLVQLVIWFVWVYITYLVLARAFAAAVAFQELVRTMGLAFAPVALSVLVGIAPLAVPFGVFSLSAAFLFNNIAIEKTSGVTTREATFANLAGFGLFVVFMGAFANIAEAGTFGGLAPGLLFFSLDF